jgi:hypothetical protein
MHRQDDETRAKTHLRLDDYTASRPELQGHPQAS